MRITVKAKASSKEDKVEKITQPSFDFASEDKKELIYKVWVKEPAEDGKANEAIIKILAKYFNVNRVNVRLLLGANNKVKVFDIDGFDLD